VYLGVSFFIPSFKISLIRLFGGSIKSIFAAARITSFMKHHFGFAASFNKLWKSGINSKGDHWSFNVHGVFFE
jgi:hypothetical protein